MTTQARNRFGRPTRSRGETTFGQGGGGAGGSAFNIPVLSAPDDGTPTSSGTSGAFVTLAGVGSGRLYVGVVTNGGTATNAQIIAGTGGNLVAGASTNQLVNAIGTQTVTTIAGLAAATAYQIIFLVVAGNNQVSNQSSVNLTTTA